MNILVTGGTGYIGSHTVVELIKQGHNPIILDNLSNSSIDVIDRIKEITGIAPAFYQLDIRDEEGLSQVFNDNSIDMVIHLAGLKAVGESVKMPTVYYDNNVNGSKTLVAAMNEHGVKNIIFSSSATVYGNPDTVPITEEMPKKTPSSPYGETKSLVEDVLIQTHQQDPSWKVVILRYFNPIGAHKSGLIGESPKGIPNNLMPYIAKVGTGKLDHLTVFGNDYDTPDGTGIRDYIHVVDLAKGHVAALNSTSGVNIYNLGTGKGTSVLQLISTFEQVNNIKIPYVIGPRREGDIAICYADPSKIKRELGWQANLTLEDMCKDTWVWENR